MSEETRLEDYIEYVDYNKETKVLRITFNPIIQTGNDPIFKNNIQQEGNKFTLSVSLDGTVTHDNEDFDLSNITEIETVYFYCDGILVKSVDYNHKEKGFCVLFVDDIKYIKFTQGAEYLFTIAATYFDDYHVRYNFLIEIPSVYLVDGEIEYSKVVPKPISEIFEIQNEEGDGKKYLNLRKCYLDMDLFLCSYTLYRTNCFVNTYEEPDEDDDDFSHLNCKVNLIVSGEFPKEILECLPLPYMFYITEEKNCEENEKHKIYVQSINKAPLPFGIANN